MMRIAFQVNVISRCHHHGEMDMEKTRHFLLLEAHLTSMSEKEDSQEFARCAAKAESEALEIMGARLPKPWTSSVEEVKWQILP